MLIAFTGFKGVGKSPAAKHIIETYGFTPLNFKAAMIAEMKIKLAETLAALAKHYYNDPTQIDRLFDEKPPIMRELMQNFGTDIMRAENPDYWVDQWIEAYNPLIHTVVDDVRFPNEAEAVLRHGGIIIQLQRPDITTGGSHSSELHFLTIEPDYTIVSEPGKPETLYRALDHLYFNEL